MIVFSPLITLVPDGHDHIPHSPNQNINATTSAQNILGTDYCIILVTSIASMASLIHLAGWKILFNATSPSQTCLGWAGRAT